MVETCTLSLFSGSFLSYHIFTSFLCSSSSLSTILIHGLSVFHSYATLMNSTIFLPIIA